MKITQNDIGKSFLVGPDRFNLLFRARLIKINENGNLVLTCSNGHNTVAFDETRLYQEIEPGAPVWWRLVDGKLERAA